MRDSWQTAPRIISMATGMDWRCGVLFESAAFNHIWNRIDTFFITFGENTDDPVSSGSLHGSKGTESAQINSSWKRVLGWSSGAGIELLATTSNKYSVPTDWFSECCWAQPDRIQTLEQRLQGDADGDQTSKVTKSRFHPLAPLKAAERLWAGEGGGVGGRRLREMKERGK